MENKVESTKVEPVQSTGKQQIIDEQFRSLASDSLLKVYQSIFDSVKEISSHLRYSTINRLGTKNEFGDERIDMDVQTDSLIYENLKKSKVVATALSEERPYPTQLSKSGEHIVTFDPIDGGNLIDSNYTVGTIFCIWPKGDLNGMTGRDIVAAALAVYGSRTSIIIYNSLLKTVEEWTLRVLEGELEYQWEKTKENIRVAKTTRIFSPANSRAILDNIAYRQMIEFWTRSGYVLRYTGSLSADAYHLFMKGEGLYCSLGSKIQKKKLRILYECAPIAFLIEKAGGLSSNGEVSMLDVIVEGYYQKTDFIVGSKEEVERLQRFVTAEKRKKRAASPLGKPGSRKYRVPEPKDNEEEERYY